MTGQTDLLLHQDGLWFSSHLAPEDEMFQRAWSIYTASFVDFERRSLFEHLHVMRQPRYRFSAIRRGQEVVGVIGMWALPGFCFIEHVAIADAFRSAGLGQQALRAVQRHVGGPVVLDVEPFGTDFYAARRVAFYHRLGFHYCGRSVTLPPYAGKTTEPSNLMAWPLALDEASCAQVVETIEREVYGLHPLIPRHRAV
ncbi:MAG: GNAT family N-acetyltransferase [Kiritimatiellae bacterium]|nr:GNAT family N-acetyltransferase [Kiritimatiellia bacterium]